MNFGSKIERLAQSTFSHVATSFILMGSWAFFANHAHGTGPALVAALVQGTLSGVITLGMKKALEHIFEHFHQRGQHKASVFLTPLLVCSVSASTLALCHFIARTPEILMTIITPSSVALFYAYVYTFSLKRLRTKSVTPD